MQEKKYTRDQIKDAIWQELKESDYTGENNDRAYEIIGIVMAGVDKIMPERTYGENEYPDLSSATPEQKAETINGLVLITAKEVLKMFYAFGLKTHIECTVINDPTKEEFDFIFRKKGAAAVRKEDWIDVNDQLPEEGGRYWCYVQHLTDTGMSYFQWNCDYNPQLRRFSDMTLRDGEQITHWRELPPPPTKQKQC